MEKTEYAFNISRSATAGDLLLAGLLVVIIIALIAVVSNTGEIARNTSRKELSESDRSH